VSFQQTCRPATEPQPSWLPLLTGPPLSTRHVRKTQCSITLFTTCSYFLIILLLWYKRVPCGLKYIGGPIKIVHKLVSSITCVLKISEHRKWPQFIQPRNGASCYVNCHSLLCYMQPACVSCMVPINCLRILASSTVVFRCPRFQTAPHREHCLRYNRPIKQLHVAFAWRASYYCLVTTKLQSNRFSKSSQYKISRNSVKRHPGSVDGRTDMTKLMVVFPHAVAKAPQTDVPLFCSKHKDKIFQMPRQRFPRM
jgi:hypothetical protein